MRWILVFAPLAAACADPDPAYPTDTCTFDPQFEGTAAIDDRSQLGFSGTDVIDRLDARPPGTLTWHDGGTTQIHLDVVARDLLARVSAPPPNQGYCSPTIHAGAMLHVRTDDGRIDSTIATTLVALGHDGAIEVIFPGGAGLPFTEVDDLAIPASWHAAHRPNESLDLRFAVMGTGDLSPYCVVDEVVSDDPDARCNTYAGSIDFWASADIPDHHNPPPDPYFTAAVGWWTWP